MNSTFVVPIFMLAFSLSIPNTSFTAHDPEQDQHGMPFSGKERDEESSDNQNKELLMPSKALCGVCNKPASSQCARCRIIYYCSRQCQTADWKKHKNECNRSVAKAAIKNIENKSIRPLSELQQIINGRRLSDLEEIIREEKSKSRTQRQLMKQLRDLLE